MNTTITNILDSKVLFTGNKKTSLESNFCEFVIKAFKKQNVVCYYPSAGACIDDIVFFDCGILKGKGLEKTISINIETFKPSLYIHTDALRYDCDMGLILKSKGYKILESFKLEYQTENKTEEKTSSVIKFRGTSDERICYLWYLEEMTNEKFLSEFILPFMLQIPVIYSVCDGILHGMGRVENSVPTALYPLVAKQLGIKYIITEQSYDFVYKYDSNKIFNIQEWVKNLNSCIPTQDIKLLSEMNEDQVQQLIKDLLRKIKETKTGNRFYDNDIVIKDLRKI